MKLQHTMVDTIDRDIEEAHASYRNGWCHGARGVPSGIFTDGHRSAHADEYSQGREDGKASFDMAMDKARKRLDATRDERKAADRSKVW